MHLSTKNIEEWNSAIYSFIDEANGEINKITDYTQQNMGTTMALLIINENKAKVYNLGDSRIYLYSNGTLKQLSRDHTVAAQLVEVGLISESEAKSHSQRNKLTRHLGLSKNDSDVRPNVTELYVNNGDMFILCSDGLTEVYSDSEIVDLLKQKRLNGNIAEELVNGALSSGSRDNITVITIQI